MPLLSGWCVEMSKDAPAAAEPILAQAATIQAQIDKNASDSAINSKNALQNQQDANEIAVARVALNNQKHDLDARQATLTAAEAKIGGN